MYALSCGFLTEIKWSDGVVRPGLAILSPSHLLQKYESLYEDERELVFSAFMEVDPEVADFLDSGNLEGLENCLEMDVY